MAFWSFQSLYHEVNFSLLQDVETAEKNVLPTADDVKAEKTHQVMNDVPNLCSIYVLCSFSKSLCYPLLFSCHSSMLKGLIEGVENFSAEKLKSVKTREPASGKDGEQRILMSVCWCMGVNQDILNTIIHKITRLQTRLRREAKYVRQNEFAAFRSFYEYSS